VSGLFRNALWLVVVGGLLAPAGGAWAQAHAQVKANAADAPTFRLAGNASANYIVEPEITKEFTGFHVLRRGPGEGWKRVTMDPILGSPFLAAAVGEELHIFFPPLRYGVMRPDGGGMTMRMQTDPPVAAAAAADGEARSSGVTWPAGAKPRAACEAVGFAGVSAPTLLVVVPLPGGPATRSEPAEATTEPATQTTDWTHVDGMPTEKTAAVTATQPGAVVREELALFQHVESQWVYRGSVTTTGVGRDTRVFLAVLDGTAYVLIDQGRRGKQLFAVHPDSPPRGIDLPAGMASSQSLALLGMDRTLMLLTTASPHDRTRAEEAQTQPADDPATAPAVESATTPAPGAVGMAIWLYNGRSFDRNIVHTAKGPMIWPANDLPQAARWGDYIQLVWGRLKQHSARLSPNGMLNEPVAVDAAARANPEAAKEAFRWFMMGAMAAVIVLTMLSKPTGAPKPFSLPPYMQLGKLGRRLVATMLDLLPCMAIGMAIAGWDEAAEGLRAWMQPGTTGAAYIAMMIGMALLLIFSTVSEVKTGATFGKRMMGLCVIGDEGQKPTWKAIALRNVVKLLELWVMLPLAVIFPLITRYRQRLGDIFARTAVVDRASLDAPPTLPEDEEKDDAEKNSNE